MIDYIRGWILGRAISIAMSEEIVRNLEIGQRPFIYLGDMARMSCTLMGKRYDNT